MNPQIDDIIKVVTMNTFESLNQCYTNRETKNGCSPNRKGSESNLIFPMYSDGRPRISEQELRFVFIEEFNKYVNNGKTEWSYSIETPTMGKYVFTDSTGKKTPRIADVRDHENGIGQSALFDMVIYDKNGKRVSLIEFKALNPDKECYKKDFVKLNNDEEGDNTVCRYFIMIVQNYTKRTIESISEKIRNRGKVQFQCYSLQKKRIITDDILNHVNK